MRHIACGKSAMRWGGRQIKEVEKEENEENIMKKVEKEWENEKCKKEKEKSEENTKNRKRVDKLASD